MITLKEKNWLNNEYEDFITQYSTWVKKDIERKMKKDSKECGTNLESKKKVFEERLSNLLVKIGVNDEDIIRALVTLEYTQIKELKGKLIEDDKSTFNLLKDSYESLIASKSFKPSFNVSFVDLLEIIVCPFCNRNYINTRIKKDGGSKSSAQLDHFFDKSSYPLFALSLNNLIPVCPSCNHIKHDKAFEVSPYEIKKGEVFFELDFGSDKYFTINGRSDSPKLDNQISILGLNKAYDCHKKDVKDLIIRKQIYTESKIEEIDKILGRSQNTINLKDLIFGKYISPEEDKKNSLSKFRREITEQLFLLD